MCLCLQIVHRHRLFCHRITGITWAKSVIEEDFPSNCREMTVLIKVLITGGNPILGYFKLCLFTKWYLQPRIKCINYIGFFSECLARNCLICQISHTDNPCSCRIVWGMIIIVEIQLRICVKQPGDRNAI